MIKTLPDKWVRKAVYTAINNIDVNGVKIPCFDTRVPNNDKRSFYVLMSTQSNDVNKTVKCEYSWNSQILLDVITAYDINGNTGSRKMADDILDAIKTATDSLVLDVASNLKIVTQTQSFPADFETETVNEIVYRKLMRIEFLIN